ncbi:MAG TPA: PLP-dependent aminotransferase family protein [Treponemataceae bacterium]|nr:PLP-dependent aminotransferase family protein [Treponemataceae bacterium]
MGSVVVQVNHRSDVPIRSQIADAYAAAIRDGKLKGGGKMPSIRALASRLGISPATVVAAYRELVSRGLVTAAPRSSFCVAGKAPSEGVPRAILPLNKIEPNLRLHPVAAMGSLIGQVAEEDPLAGGYEDYRGNARLLEAIADLDRELGIESEPKGGMLVTSGCQQAISLTARAFPRGARIAVEDPCYPGARLAFAGAGAEIVPVAMGDDGPSGAALREISKAGKVALFYCCPTYGNPSGRSWSVDARSRVLAAAKAGGFMIFEDDFLGDLDYEDEGLPRLAAMAREYPGVRVIRARTFSKTLLPTLRIAGVSGDPDFIARLLSLKILDDVGCSAFLQRALARFIGDGLYEEHLARVKPHYRELRGALRSALSGSPGGFSFGDPKAGLCLLAHIPEGIDSTRLVPECAAAGVPLCAGSDYFSRPSDGAGLIRIGFGALDVNEVPRAVAALERAVIASRGFSQIHSVV